MPEQPSAANHDSTANGAAGGAPPPPTAAGTQPAPDPESVVDRPLLLLAGTVVLGAVMVILDTTIIAVATESLSRQFDTSLSTISWVTTGYLLALAVVIPLAAWSCQRFGATRMWNTSLVLFTLGSALCGTAWSAGSLIAFRVLQGIGGGLIMPICMTLLAAAAGPKRLGRVMAIIGVPSLLAPVFGPVIGGLIVDNLDWRWIFFVNLPVGAIALLASLRVLPRDDRGSASQRLDIPGLLLVSPGLALLVFGLSEAGNGGGFGAARVVVSVVVGVVLVTAFVGYALRRRDGALLDMRLFRYRSFSVASVATLVIGAVLFAAMFLVPLYFQIVRGYSALEAGLYMAPQGLGAMVAMAIAGRVVDQRGARSVVPLGLLLTLLGTLMWTQVDGDTNSALLIVSLFVRGLGFGASMMPAMTAAYTSLPPVSVPQATTTLNILQRIGGSLATALVAVQLQHGITERIPTAGGAEDGATMLETAAQAGLPAPIANQIGEAFGETFWWVIGLSVIGFVASLFLPNAPASQAAGRQGLSLIQISQPTTTS
ncbi:MAG: DHA2 family efflux MFS transporter permease subunit [Frankia sp.]|nr:DHA2 family efflux MFS transporter permease subunit [Frankia sp.]